MNPEVKKLNPDLIVGFRPILDPPMIRLSRVLIVLCCAFNDRQLNPEFIVWQLFLRDLC